MPQPSAPANGAKPTKRYVTVTLFHSNLGWRIGHYDEATRTTEFCCTPALLKAGVCAQPNVAIINTTDSGGSAIVSSLVPFDTPANTVQIHKNYTIVTSGVYYLYS